MEGKGCVLHSPERPLPHCCGCWRFPGTSFGGLIPAQSHRRGGASGLCLRAPLPTSRSGGLRIYTPAPCAPGRPSGPNGYGAGSPRQAHALGRRVTGACGQVSKTQDMAVLVEGQFVMLASMSGLPSPPFFRASPLDGGPVHEWQPSLRARSLATGLRRPLGLPCRVPATLIEAEVAPYDLLRDMWWHLFTSVQ
mgnify:CR=1 FL=1